LPSTHSTIPDAKPPDNGYDGQLEEQPQRHPGNPIMKIRSITPYLAAATALAMVPQFASAESAQEIVEKFETQKLAALEAYQKANPEADDKEATITALIDSAAALQDQGKLLTYLEQKYQIMDKGPQADLQTLIGGVVQPLIGSKKATGDTAGALAFIEQVKADLAENPESEGINRFLDQLAGQLSQPQVGSKMDIAFTSTAGDEIDLSKMDGKVVLVDFWATWCGPCIAEMPNVIAAYEKYQAKGFEVVGISLDQDKEKLAAFIKDNGMTWPQYFDGKGWENEISTKFGIGSIPATYLIGKDGKIVATDLRGGALEAKLDELLK
jgi:thiol-disulfide isomerase/thioredoxin